MVAAFGIEFTDLRQKCLKFHLGGFSQAVKNIFSSNPYVAFGHGLHGLTENVLVNAKKFTCGRRFWHGLHGLTKKVSENAKKSTCGHRFWH